MIRYLVRITVIATIAALACAGFMKMFVDDIHPAIVGGVVGGVTGALAATVPRKKPPAASE